MAADDAFAEQVMTEHGIPEDVRLALVAVFAGYRHWGRVAHGHAPALDRLGARPARRTLRVLHRPGHSPSDTLFHDAARGSCSAPTTSSGTSPPTR